MYTYTYPPVYVARLALEQAVEHMMISFLFVFELYGGAFIS